MPRRQLVLFKILIIVRESQTMGLLGKIDRHIAINTHYKVHYKLFLRAAM